MNLEEATNYKRLEIWLEELKELREYKRKMKTQFLDDIENPLEPIKLSSALESEIFKYEYRAEHGMIPADGEMQQPKRQGTIVIKVFWHGKK